MKPVTQDHQYNKCWSIVDETEALKRQRIQNVEVLCNHPALTTHKMKALDIIIQSSQKESIDSEVILIIR